MSVRGMDRRLFLQRGIVGGAGLGMTGWRAAAQPQPRPAAKETSGQPTKPTRFQIACMTLPYAAFSLERALTGIQKAGYRFVAWGTNHQGEGKKSIPVLAGDATPDQ